MGHEPDAEPGSEPRWLPVAEAARALGVTEHAVRRRIKRGTLQSRRETVGNHVRTLVAIPVANADENKVENPGGNRLANAETRAAVAEALVAELRERVEELRADLVRERQAREEAERRRAEDDRRLDEMLRQIGELREERQQRRPWPGLRRWWRRFVEGEVRAGNR